MKRVESLVSLIQSLGRSECKCSIRPWLHSLCVPLNNAGCTVTVWNYCSWKRRSVWLHSSIMELTVLSFNIFIFWFFCGHAHTTSVAQMKFSVKKDLAPRKLPSSSNNVTPLFAVLSERVWCHFTLGSDSAGWIRVLFLECEIMAMNKAWRDGVNFFFFCHALCWEWDLCKQKYKK